MARVRAGATISTFQFFPNFGRQGGDHGKSIFFKFKKDQVFLGGRGQENYGLFPQFVTFFVLIAHLISYLDEQVNR